MEPLPVMPLPSALSSLLRKALPVFPRPVGPEDAARLPAVPGVYVLLLRLDEACALAGPFDGRELAAGWHAYVGSARGPGGLRARLGRHLRRRKKPRWHVDQLTMRAAQIWALPIIEVPTPGPGLLTECILAKRLLATGAFTCPLPGFGSSGCTACESHLLAWRAPDAGTWAREP